MALFDFDPKEMNQASEDADNKKLWLNVANSAANSILSAPSASEIMLNQKRAPINVGLDKVASGISDPWEKQKKTYEAYKAAKEGQALEADSDPNSKSNMALDALLVSKYKADPAQLRGLTKSQKMELFGNPGKLAEIEAQSAVDFDKQKRLKQMEFANQKELKRIEANRPGKAFDNLSKDNQELILGLSKKNADKIGISNQIDAVLSKWDSLPDDQKVSQGRQLLKTLNSTEGKDAIGAEEAERLGSMLEFAYGNFTNSNPTQFGRDLEGFKEQADLTSKGIKSAINANQKLVDQAYGGLNGQSPLYQAAAQKPELPKAPEKGLIGSLIPNAKAANSSPVVSKKLYNSQLNKTKFIMSDGTEMEVEGRQ